MKITKKQLNEIIKEALGDRGDLPKKKQYRIGMRGPEDLPMKKSPAPDPRTAQLFDQAFEQMKAFEADPKDMSDMEQIRDTYYEDMEHGEPSMYLKRLASSVDTIIREQIPQSVYYWIFPDLLEGVIIKENKVKDVYDKLKSAHGWLMKPENDWIRKMAIKMLSDKDVPEKEEVKDAKVQAEAHQPLTEKKSKGMGAIAAYKKLKGMYNWAMSDENKWVRDIMVDMLKSGDTPDEKVISKEIEDGNDPFAGAVKPYVAADKKSLDDKKPGDKTPSKKVIADIEKQDDSFVFLLDDGEIETYKKPDSPQAKGNYLLMKEQKMLRYALIREAHSRLKARKIALM